MHNFYYVPIIDHKLQPKRIKSKIARVEITSEYKKNWPKVLIKNVCSFKFVEKRCNSANKKKNSFKLLKV